MLKSTSRSKNWAYLLMHLSNTAGPLDCVEVGTQVFTELFSSTVICEAVYVAAARGAPYSANGPPLKR